MRGKGGRVKMRGRGERVRRRGFEMMISTFVVVNVKVVGG